MLSKNGWSKESLVLISLGINFLITGGLHLDGLMDTADGIAAGNDKLMEAMKDSRVGAIGIQTFFLIISFQIAALIKLGEMAPLIIPIASFWGRVSPLWAIEKFPYLNPNGLSQFHKKYWQGIIKELQPSLLVLIIASSYVIFKSTELNRPLVLLINILLGILPTILIPNLLGYRLKGHNGDSYGACLVIVETFIFLTAAITF